MTSQVSICNLALVAIGSSAFIQSMDEESVEARYAKLVYDAARRAVLRAHPWNFATVRDSLASVTAQKSKYSYSYALPTKCIKARYIVPLIPDEKIPFEVALSNDGSFRILHTDMPDAELAFTYDLENPDLFDPMFVDTFALGLASRLAPVIAPAKAQDALAKYINALRGAQAADASEGEAEAVETTDWMEVRLSGTTSYVRRVE